MGIMFSETLFSDVAFTASSFQMWFHLHGYRNVNTQLFVNNYYEDARSSSYHLLKHDQVT